MPEENHSLNPNSLMGLRKEFDDFRLNIMRDFLSVIKSLNERVAKIEQTLKDKP